MRTTRHAIANELYEVGGDTARGEVYAQFHGVDTEGGSHTMLLRYADRFVRRDGRRLLLEREPIAERGFRALEGDVARMSGGTRDAVPDRPGVLTGGGRA